VVLVRNPDFKTTADYRHIAKSGKIDRAIH
jgi:hypothetical protein